MILECYDLLKEMEARPVMYTGERTLKSIDTYISGYYHALCFHQVLKQPPKRDHFFDWVAEKLGYYESTAGWVNMILAHCGGFNPKKIDWDEVFKTSFTEEQHQKSINLFYELVKEFKAETERNNTLKTE